MWQNRAVNVDILVVVVEVRVRDVHVYVHVSVHVSVNASVNVSEQADLVDLADGMGTSCVDMRLDMEGGSHSDAHFLWNVHELATDTLDLLLATTEGAFDRRI